MCKICSELPVKPPEQRHWRRSGVFIVNFEDNSHIFYLFIVYFEQVNADWKYSIKFLDSVTCLLDYIYFSF